LLELREIASRAIEIRGRIRRARHRIGNHAKMSGNTSENYQYADRGAPRESLLDKMISIKIDDVNVANGTP